MFFMDYRKKFLVKPGSKVRMGQIDTAFKGNYESEEPAKAEIEHARGRVTAQRYLLYAEKKDCSLIVLQALDAGDKDGAIRHRYECDESAGHGGHRVQRADGPGAGP